MKNKKADVDPMKLIVLFIILAIVATIMIYYFNTQFGKENKIVGEQIDKLGDSDGDGVANFLDKCPNGGISGKSEYQGCSSEDELNRVTGKNE